MLHMDTSAFAPINNPEVMVDLVGYEWEKVSVLGWRRKVDRFFWPSNPNVYFNGRYPPTPEEVAQLRVPTVQVQ